MFGMFRKKLKTSPFVEFLTMSDSLYASTVEELFNNMDPVTRGNVLVAYENLLVTMGVLHSIAVEKGTEFTVDQLILQFSEEQERTKNDEINSRRFSWFLFAALLARMEKFSTKNSSVTYVACNIWCQLADDSPILKSTLPNNIVWKDEEKEWFDLSLEDMKFVQWTVNHAMPSQFASSEIVKSFSNERGLFYMPSSSRIGFVP